MRTPRHLFLILTVLIFSASGLFPAGFRLAAPISDHMVLQRDKPVAVWGWAEPGEGVTVSFAGQSKSTTANTSGKWLIYLDALPASAEARALTVSGKDGHKLEVKDVLVGEVWLGSGQSNMAMRVQSSQNFPAEKSAATYPLIRHYQESSGPSDIPQAEGKGAWNVCNPDSVGAFSAVLYFFGREIHREEKVPVGLINTSVGGTPIESWVSAETQISDPETNANYDKEMDAYQKFDAAKNAAIYQKQQASWKAAVEKAKADKTKLPQPPRDLNAMRKAKGGPSALYNGKVVNLAPYTLRGMLWYQGEGNAGKPELYKKQLTQLVTSWRVLWGDEVPFAWVQLPNYRDSNSESWPRIRESMMKVLALPKTGMAITLDIGNPTDIHPANKQDVGKRLSYWALSTVYNRKVPAISGPLPAGHEVKGAAISIRFQHGEGLKTRDGGAPRGFLIAGVDKAWKPASAQIEGNTVTVSSPEVPAPMAVRYAWAENPNCNLVNAADLPATSFRTDDWPVPTK